MYDERFCTVALYWCSTSYLVCLCDDIVLLMEYAVYRVLPFINMDN